MTSLSINRKISLQLWYKEVFSKFSALLARTPGEGLILELGSGDGQAKDIIPKLITSDVVAASGVDLVIDATQLPFKENQVKAIFMVNALHHISNVEAFFQEAKRCLRTEGRIFIVDQFPVFFGKPILKYFHPEPFDETANWKFHSSDPLTGANGAMSWILFVRDREKFQRLFPYLIVESIHFHSPLRYWLCGGKRSWSLLPAWLFGAATLLDNALIQVWPGFGSYIDVEIRKRK